MTGRARAESALSEAAFQRRILDTAKLHGWLRVHIRAVQVRSGRWVTPYEGDTGLPDLILARRGRVLLAELKSQTGGWRPGQREWLAELGEYGRLWRPSDWDSVLEELR